MMKSYFKIPLLLFVFVAMLFASCQSEENEVSEPNPENLTASSPMTALLRRMSIEDVANDNGVDSTACYKLLLPVDVSVNTQSVTVTTVDDYPLVAAILNESNDDVDSIEFVFPITIIATNGDEIVVTSQSQFDELKESCQEPIENQDPINCIGINYPITIFKYDPDFQISGTSVISNDTDFLLLLLNLTLTEYYSISYPISVSTLNGIVAVNNNDELMAAINSAIIACDTPIDPCFNPQVLTDSLIVYIPFSNELKNLTGRGTPTISGNYHFITDRDGNPNGAFSFDDGTNNGQNSIDIELGTTVNSDNDIMRYNNFTFSLWVKRQDNSGANPNEMIISNLAFSLFMGITEDPSIKAPMVVFGNNIDTPLNDPSWINQGLGSDTANWHHLVVSYDGTLNLLRLYRNGVLTAAASPNGMNYIPRIIFGNRYKGFIDDIRVYNKLLTDAEVNQLYELEGDINTCLQ